MQAFEQTLQLVDAKGRKIGTVTIDSKIDQLLTGEFIPDPGFSRVEELFQKFEEAVNVQAFSIVDKLDKQIADLGLQLYSPEHGQSIKIHDVQIWSDGGFSCRLTRESIRPVNGLCHSAKESTFSKSVGVTLAQPSIAAVE